MKKKLLVGGVIVLIPFLMGYVIFTLKSGGKLNEASPLEHMSKNELSAFMKEVEDQRNNVMEKAETMPVRASLLARGDFMRRFHAVKGRALLIRDGDARIVRFEDFDTDNGPQLHIYLSASLDANNFIDLGPIKATKGNVNYTLPAGADTAKYRYVLVWCKPFGVLFSSAELVSL